MSKSRQKKTPLSEKHFRGASAAKLITICKRDNIAYHDGVLHREQFACHICIPLLFIDNYLICRKTRECYVKDIDNTENI